MNDATRSVPPSRVEIGQLLAIAERDLEQSRMLLLPTRTRGTPLPTTPRCTWRPWRLCTCTASASERRTSTCTFAELVLNPLGVVVPVAIGIFAANANGQT